ncbi:MAG: M20 family metallo-hydrolase [Paludibacteraceae bacterium]
MYEIETIEAVELLKKMISIPSISREETMVADFFENFIKEKGFNPERLGNNLYIFGNQYDETKKTILLNSHIDTVKPVSGWTIDPFSATETNGKIYGVGSNDAGASVVSLFEAFCILNKTKLPYNLIYLASAEEEISGKNGIEWAMKKLPKIDLAVIGEPTNMKMAIAEKGLMVLDCVVYGKAGHAARDEGENAIYKAIKEIDWFQNYTFEKKSELLGNVKMSVTQINSGTQHNVVPDKCTFIVDIRSNELYSNEELLEIIKEKISCEVSARSTRLSSTKTPDNHCIIQKAKKLNIDLFGSPTLSDQALLSCVSVKIGPGNSERSHTANEFIALNEIKEAIEKYVELLVNLIF